MYHLLYILSILFINFNFNKVLWEGVKVDTCYIDLRSSLSSKPNECILTSTGQHAVVTSYVLTK